MERYQVTDIDRQRIKIQPDMLKVSGDQVFATLQGEGVTAGSKAVFLRLHLCNLNCSWCDTKYTWDKKRSEFWQESEDWTYFDTANRVKKLWLEEFGDRAKDEEKRIVITGGEPLLQKTKIIKLLEFLPNWKVEIETNGTVDPGSELAGCQINCSPKLENSGVPKERRYRPEALRAINNMPNSWFKFVVVDPKDLDEVEQLINERELDKGKILIMPEGRNLDATLTHLEAIQGGVNRRGWKIAKRNQFEWFGDKRRT